MWYSKNAKVVQEVDQFELKWSEKISWREEWL